MPTVIPYVPQQITVHLGAPNQSAPNVTVPFVDYVKNVASSEIYPTWDESALRANILAIVSYALNRVYTEFYRSRGYDFDITNSTAYDQYFVYGRSYFSNISRLVDELFNGYLRRPGFVEPLAAKFCNGTTVTCEGLSQWGSQRLAQQGQNSTQILRNYYGNVEIVPNAPIRGITSSYPGSPLRRGSTGPNVVVIQTLNDVTVQTVGVGAQLDDGQYLGALQGHATGHDQTDVAGAKNDHLFAHHVAFAVDELLGGTGAEHTGGTGTGGIQRATAPFPAAHGQDHGLGLDLQNTLAVLGGDHLVRGNGSDGGFLIHPDVPAAYFFFVDCRIFRAGQFFAQFVQAKAVVDTLHQNAAQLGLPVQNDHIPATGIVGCYCGCHTGRTAADDNDIVILHITHRSFL